MLQIKNISKTYKTGNLVQRALDDVSLNLRDNEFVAILGPSGSGKTTLLNIIGGLDRYDSGDLIINGISTKKYKDRDWDSYRNHTVGFVFQSYNLIPHQTVLANVELALTISGISGKERRERAIKALEEVGLGDQLHKKPNQMSGGQMQRVSLARALVNNPDILLADEPTGALDSETSIQVMDLLKEVAKDRLVVMVTHNPELAYQYATRIVKVKDGKLLEDSDPYEIPEGEAPVPVHKNMGKSSMSFLTALSLSFNNLKTKKARTILVSFAGSIGIIGIAMILSLSNGVNNYIRGVEEDTIREYPLTVDSSGFDMSAMFTRGGDGDAGKSAKKGEIRELQTVTNMASVMESNDLKSLKKYIDSGKSNLEKHTRAIEYSYDVKPQIFRKVDTEYRKVNPDETRKKMGMSISSSMAYSSMMSTDVFHQLPSDPSLYRDEYDVKAGHWPKKYNECVLVLSKEGMASDIALYAMGLKNMDDLDKMLKDFSKGKDVHSDEDQTESFNYNDCMGIKFKMIGSSDYYTYDSSQNVWVDRSEDDSHMDSVVSKGEDLKIVGVVKPKKDVDFTVLNGDIYYPASLTDHLIRKAANSKVVRAQKKSRDINILTGKEFGEESDGPDFESMFSFDKNAFAKAFQFDPSQIGKAMKAPSKKMDMSGLIDPKAVTQMPGMSQGDIQKLMQSTKLNFTQESMQELFGGLMKGFLEYSAKKGTDYTKMNTAFQDYMKSPAAKKILSDNMSRILKAHVEAQLKDENLQDTMKDVLQDFPKYLKDKGITDPDGITDETIDGFLASQGVQDKLSAKMTSLKTKLENVEISDEDGDRIMTELMEGYAKFAKENNYPTTQQMQQDFQEYLSTPEAQKIINSTVAKSMDTSALEKNLATAMSGYTAKAVASMSEKLVSGMMTNYMKSMGSLDFSKAFKIDTDAFADAMGMNMSESEIQSLITSLMNTQANTYEGNMKSFGYAKKSNPTQIAIYAKDYESKAEVKDILDGYNRKMVKAGKNDQEITYNDLAGALMGSVTNIIDAISYVLIAFVSISLVVSSIMIGVITYISVLERRKEIGILRAIGASKRNVGQVFNAETFIIGALAGLIGIGVTEILIIPTNIIIGHVTSVSMHVSLPVVGGIVLVILSIILTLIGGIIPSRKAAKSDPVTAMRVD